MRSVYTWSAKVFFSVLILSFLIFSYANADEIDASEESEFEVLERGATEITIDAEIDDWRQVEDVLVMGEDTWEELGGSWDGDDDLVARMRVIYDTDNLYFLLVVTDDEYVAQGGTPWENDGIQMAINSMTDSFPPAAGLGPDTHLYNFSIANGWQQENGAFLGDAEIEMRRDDDTKENIFEWRMDTEIFDDGIELEAGRQIAFAIIANDSDEDAPGQTGWVGWGSQTIVFGKNPEQMQTLILSSRSVAVEARNKLLSTWGALKY